ncbi:MAG: hypothetical protein IMW94_08805 [Thermoanaerobacter sp.]|nr:hypothetical protein [Thermoanaerobacter sp.]
MYERRKKNREQNLKQLSKGQNVLSDVEGSNATAKAIASLAGVGQATIRRAAEFAKAVDGMVKYRRYHLGFTSFHGTPDCPLRRAFSF